MLRKLFFSSICCVILGITAVPVQAGNVKLIKGENGAIEGGEFDGYYAWDILANWDTGAFPSIANGDDVIQDWTLNNSKILVDDFDPNVVKECVNYKVWTPQNTVLLIDSSVEGGPGGVLTISNDMRLARAGKFNNKVIVKKGVLNAGRIRTGDAGNSNQATTRSEVTIEVHEDGVINCDEIRLNEIPRQPDSFGKITMLGGVLNVSGALKTGGTPGSSALNLNGGTVHMGSLDVKGDFVVDVNGGTLVLDGDAAGAIAALSVSGQVTVAGVTAMRGGLIVDVDDEKTTITSDPSIVDVNQAWDPSPLGSGIAHDTAKLMWTAGDNTVATQGHEAFFGMDPNVTSIGKVTDPEIVLSDALQLGRTYYWRVDETTTDGKVVEGNLWSFTVRETIVVDDFESYTAENIDDPNAVFNFWQDGLVDPSLGGSLSGHADAPFVETYDRWQGNQSLPMYYDNNDVITTSVVKYMLPEAADWTKYGLKSLSLNFRGDGGNTVGDVYVLINDVKVPYALSATHFTDMWHTWIVNLAGVDAAVLSNVTSIGVGVDGANVAGILYIDNIHLTSEEAETLTASTPDDSALVAHYKLDGNFNDSTGNGNDAVAATAFTWVDGGERGTAWDANADMGAIVPSNFDPSAGTNTFTMSVWMNFQGDSTHPDDQDDIQHIFTKSSGWGGNTMMFQIEVKQHMWTNPERDAHKSGRLVYAVHQSVADQREFHKVPVGEWSHNALVFDGEKITGYLNGIPGVMPFPTKMGTMNDADVFIGNADPAGGVAWRGLNSLLSDMRIYSAPLTQAEIMGLAGRTDEVYKAID